MAKPRYSSTERIGVNAVENIIISEFKWIFREQPIADMGIDAHIEIVEDGEPSGVVIGVQIKSGDSHVVRKKGSLVFYFNNVHYNYWTKHSLPLLLIIYLPNSRITYWQFLNKITIKKSKKKNWKIELPLSQELNAASMEPIKSYIKKQSNPISEFLKASNKLEDSSPNWRVRHHTYAKTELFFLEAKHDLADKEEPLSFTLSLREDLVIDGINIQDILLNSSVIKEPIYLPKDAIVNVESSDFLKNVMNFNEVAGGIYIVPLKRIRNTALKFIDYQANELILDNIFVELESNLNGKTIFSNKNQDISLSFDTNIF